jgi:predicted membrane channel-forming protein YqfA (hemolysin III family)
MNKTCLSFFSFCLMLCSMRCAIIIMCCIGEMKNLDSNTQKHSSVFVFAVSYILYLIILYRICLVSVVFVLQCSLEWCCILCNTTRARGARRVFLASYLRLNLLLVSSVRTGLPSTLFEFKERKGKRRKGKVLHSYYRGICPRGKYFS